MTDVTRILSAIEEGDSQAAEQLLPLVYDELRNGGSQDGPGEAGADAAGHGLVDSENAMEVQSHIYADPI